MNVYNQPQPKRSSVLSVLSSMGSIHDDASLELFDNSNRNTPQDNSGNSTTPTTNTETFLPTIFSSLPSSSTSPTRISSLSASSEVVMNDNNNEEKNNEKNTEKVSLEEIRRKSKNLKDLVANFWMHSESTPSPSSCSSNCHNNDTTNTAPSSTTNSNTVHRTACTNNRHNTGYGISSKKSDESIGSLFGNFHPIDLTAPRSGKSVAATAAAIDKQQQHDTNTKWIEAPGNRKHSLSGPMFPTKDMMSFQNNISASSISSSFSDAATRVSLNNNNINSCTGTSTSTNSCAINPITTNRSSNSTTLNCGNMNNTISNTTSHSNTNIAAVPSAAAAVAPSSTAGSSSYSTCSKNHWTHSSVVDTPGQYDIVCGRNSGAYNYIGNRRFRVTIDMNLQRYIAAPTREAKTNVIQAIVRMLHDNIGARFLKKSLVNVADPINGGTKKIARYTVMTEKQAREKVGHALRDLVIAARKEQHHLQHEQQQQHE